MYSMVLMAALTTGTDMPDRGRRGGCCGCYGGMGMGMGWGGGYGMGMGYGGCYGGMGMGMMGWGGGYRMGWGGGYGYGGYAYSPMISSWGLGTSLVSAGTILNPGTQSFYYNPNSANEATLIVHLPESASLSIDGQPMRQSSGTRTFTSPPLEQGKTYVYTVRAELNRDGHVVRDSKTIEVRAGQRSEVTMKFGNSNRRDDETGEPVPSSSSRRAPDR